MLPQVRLDRRDPRPLHDQLAAHLRALVLDGHLRPGARLPSTRRAAVEFGVSRTVVVEAYERLQLEGYLEAGVGVGTWVREELPGHLLGPEPDVDAIGGGAPIRGDGGGRTEGGHAEPVRLSRRGERVAEARLRAPLAEGGAAEGDDTVGGGTGRVRAGIAPSFRPGALDPELFPVREWARLSGRVWRSRGRELLPYGEPSGHLRLRERLVEHLSRTRAVRCDPGRIIVTAGSQHALDLVARILTDPGDPVLMEDPGYPGAHAVFEAAGARIVPVPVDGEGVADGVVRTACGPSRLLYTTPSHQYPLGVTLSLERRLRLLEWADAADAWIVEDDYDSEFRYGSRPLPSLQGLDREGRVIYMGTFSKVLAPGLRLGFLVVPSRLVDAFRAAVRVTVRHPPTALQATLAEFMAEGHLERHIGRVREVYGRRRRALAEALRVHLGDRVELLPGPAGLHLTVLLPPGTDDLALSRRVTECGVHAPALSSHYRGSEVRPGLLLGFAAMDESALRDGVEVVARALT